MSSFPPQKEIKMNDPVDQNQAETEAVRSDPELMAEIQRGLAAIKEGQTKLYTLAELFSD